MSELELTRSQPSDLEDVEDEADASTEPDLDLRTTPPRSPSARGMAAAEALHPPLQDRLSLASTCASASELLEAGSEVQDPFCKEAGSLTAEYSRCRANPVRNEAERPFDLPQIPVLPSAAMSCSTESDTSVPSSLPRTRRESFSGRPEGLDSLQEEESPQESADAAAGPDNVPSQQDAQSADKESRAMACGAMGAKTLDPSDPSSFVLPNLLQFLTVDDMLECRATSRQATSPQALIKHLEEMG
ncbi:unnamed protein product [Symbiodinium natans]|uniref:Uncharacterized protein n=1 Tax=Symbiodinium natans TaxID=878477 RepID=A0A812ILT2_9DINO|nr:unnamed protein product [Symbiodinium natans]